MTSPDTGNRNGDEIGVPRAEEIIAEVYRQLTQARSAGKTATKVVMPKAYWRTVEEYRRVLGPLDGSLPDYLSEDGLFGLEIWYGKYPAIRVD